MHTTPYDAGLSLRQEQNKDVKKPLTQAEDGVKHTHMELAEFFGTDALERIKESQKNVDEVQTPVNYVKFQGKGAIDTTPWTYGPNNEKIPLEAIFMVLPQTLKHGFSGFETPGTNKPPHRVLSSWLDAFPKMPEQEWAQQITYRFETVCTHAPDKPHMEAQKFVFEERRAFKEGFAELEQALRRRLEKALTNNDQNLKERILPLITLSWKEAVDTRFGPVNMAIVSLLKGEDDERSWIGIRQTNA